MLNVIGLVFLVFTSITFNFPTLNPVTKDNMNYTSAAIGVIGFISAITWITSGRKNFTGPETGVANVNVVHGREGGDDSQSGSGSEGGTKEKLAVD